MEKRRLTRNEIQANEEIVLDRLTKDNLTTLSEFVKTKTGRKAVRTFKKRRSNKYCCAR